MFSPKTQTSRPITDRVKESLFSILYNYSLPDGAIVADLFCGVGSLGLEALSRGAQFVAFIEKDPAIIETLKKNIEKAGFVKVCKVIKTNAFKAAEAHGFAEKKYSLVFVDPPYAASDNVESDSPLCELLNTLNDQVTDDAMIIVRTSRDVILLEQYGPFRVVQRRQWGTMAVTILTKR